MDDRAVGANRRPTRRIADIADIRIDFGFAVEIDAHKLDAVIHRRRFPGHVDLRTRVDANARERHRALDRLLLFQHAPAL